MSNYSSFEERERAFREMTDWLNEALRDLHKIDVSGKKCFRFDSMQIIPYIRNDDWRRVSVEKRDDLIVIALVHNKGGSSRDYIDVVLQAWDGRLVDRGRMLPSKTNPHERWCNLRFASQFGEVSIEFIPVYGPRD